MISIPAAFINGAVLEFYLPHMRVMFRITYAASMALSGLMLCCRISAIHKSSNA